MPESTSTAANDPLDVYRATPSGEVRGGVVLIHEIWGLVDHIKDVADRIAAEGYIVAAPDILSNAGVTPQKGLSLFQHASSQDEETRAQIQPRLRELLSITHNPEYGSWAVSTLKATVDWLADQPGVDGRIAVVGFCFGGSYAFSLASEDHRLKAAVAFYGRRPGKQTLSAISCPVLGIYGELDEPLITGLGELVDDMSEQGVEFETLVYPNAAHAFFNDTNPFQYRPEPAAQAWESTLSFLGKKMGGKS